MSKGYLTTHVLDTYNGKPGSGIKGSIYIFEEGNKKKIKEFTLNEDGRCDGPILENDNFNKLRKVKVVDSGESDTRIGRIMYYNDFKRLNEVLLSQSKEPMMAEIVLDYRYYFFILIIKPMFLSNK